MSKLQTKRVPKLQTNMHERVKMYERFRVWGSRLKDSREAAAALPGTPQRAGAGAAHKGQACQLDRYQPDTDSLESPAPEISQITFNQLRVAKRLPDLALGMRGCCRYGSGLRTGDRE